MQRIDDQISKKLDRAWLEKETQNLRVSSLLLQKVKQILAFDFANIEKIKSADPWQEKNYISILALDSSFLRSKKDFKKSQYTLDQCAEYFGEMVCLQSFYYCYERFMLFYQQAQYAEALESCCQAMAVAPTLKWKISLIVCKLLVFENLGEATEKTYLAYEKARKQCGLIDQSVFVSVDQQIRAFHQRRAFRTGKIHKFLPFQFIDKDKFGQDNYFPIWVSELAFISNLHRQEDISLNKELLLNTKAYYHNKTYFIRTILGVYNNCDFMTFSKYLPDRLYLWFWKWLENPLSFNFYYISKLLEEIFLVKNNITYTCEDSHMIGNVFLWLALWDHQNRDVLLRWSEEYRRGDIKSFPILYAEKLIVEYYLKKNHDKARPISIIQSLNFNHVLLINLLDDTKNAANLTMLRTALGEFLNSDNQDNKNMIIVDLKFFVITYNDYSISSEILSKALQLFYERPIISFVDFSKKIFNFSYYDQDIHKNKIFNLLSRLKKINPILLKIKTKHSIIYCPSLIDSVKFYGLKTQDYDPNKLNNWQQIINLKLINKESSKIEMNQLKVEKYILSKGIVSNHNLQEKFEISKSSALRYINDLLKQGTIIKYGNGKKTFYKARLE